MTPVPAHMALVPYKPTGRPSSFTQHVADELCEHIAQGGSLRGFCEQDGRPNKTTVLRWLRNNEAFRIQYTRAREDQADHFFDEIMDIADDARNDWMDKQNDDGTTYRVLDHEHIQRSRVRIDARKWAAGKLRPKVYGEKIEASHTLDATQAFVSMLRDLNEPKRLG